MHRSCSTTLLAVMPRSIALHQQDKALLVVFILLVGTCMRRLSVVDKGARWMTCSPGTLFIFNAPEDTDEAEVEMRCGRFGEVL